MKVRTFSHDNFGEWIAGDNDNLIFVGGINEFLGIRSGTNDKVFINGQNDQIALQSDTGVHMIDSGKGLLLTLYPDLQSISISGFENDLRGRVHLAKTLNQPNLTPDGHGGTLLHLDGGGTVFFNGDSHLTAAQFI